MAYQSAFEKGHAYVTEALKEAEDSILVVVEKGFTSQKNYHCIIEGSFDKRLLRIIPYVLGSHRVLYVSTTLEEVVSHPEPVAIHLDKFPMGEKDAVFCDEREACRRKKDGYDLIVVWNTSNDHVLSRIHHIYQDCAVIFFTRMRISGDILDKPMILK